MTNDNTYLAIYLGDKLGNKMKAWNELSEKERNKKTQEGILAWKDWSKRHHRYIVDMGGPLGKTKRISASGIDDVTNTIGAFTVVRAESFEKAAEIFQGHPHFNNFPGESIELMPILPIPNA